MASVRDGGPSLVFSFVADSSSDKVLAQNWCQFQGDPESALPIASWAHPKKDHAAEAARFIGGGRRKGPTRHFRRVLLQAEVTATEYLESSACFLPPHIYCNSYPFGPPFYWGQADLVKRLEQLRGVVQSSSQGSRWGPFCPCVVWVLSGLWLSRLQQVQLWYGGLFFPEAFLTASRQASSPGISGHVVALGVLSTRTSKCAGIPGGCTAKASVLGGLFFGLLFHAVCSVHCSEELNLLVQIGLFPFPGLLREITAVVVCLCRWRGSLWR